MTVKKPYVRVFHQNHVGEDVYSQKLATKKLIAKAVKAKKKGYDVVVATAKTLYKGKTYTPQEWLKKYPEWKTSKPKTKAKKRKK